MIAVLQTLGYKVGKDTAKALLKDLPMRVISALLKVLKAEHQAELAERLKKNRIHVQVLTRETLLAQDSTHTGSCERHKAWAEQTKDAATLEAEAFGDGKPITEVGMIEHLEVLKDRGSLPLVLATDNGSAYKSIKVADWLAKNQVIHLFSRPRTPTDNGRAERGIGEGKGLASLGKGVELEFAALGPLILDQALQRLNQYWPRKSKGGLTAVQLKRTLPHWQSKTSRSKFYKAACSAIKAVKADSKRVQRREIREAIFRTLESFGLILRTRGDLKPQPKFQDRIS